MLLAERGFDIGDLLGVGFSEVRLNPNAGEVLRGPWPTALEVFPDETCLRVCNGTEEVGRGLSKLRLVPELIEVVEGLVPWTIVNLSTLVNQTDLQGGGWSVSAWMSVFNGSD